MSWFGGINERDIVRYCKFVLRLHVVRLGFGQLATQKPTLRLFFCVQCRGLLVRLKSEVPCNSTAINVTCFAADLLFFQLVRRPEDFLWILLNLFKLCCNRSGHRCVIGLIEVKFVTASRYTRVLLKCFLYHLMSRFAVCRKRRLRLWMHRRLH